MNTPDDRIERHGTAVPRATAAGGRAWTLLAAAALAVAACGGESPDSTRGGRAPATVTAEVVTVALSEVPDTYVTTGTLVSDERVQIASRIMGFIRNLKVREGESVSDGQRLLTIDPTQLQAAVREAEAHVASAAARLAEARAELERHRSLRAQQLIAESLYRKVELQYQVAEQDLKAAEATLGRVRSELQYAEVRSPVSGVVIAKHKENGDIATPGAPILTIEDPTRIVLRTFVKEHHVEHIRIGDPVTVRLDTERRVLGGTVAQVVPAGDPATHSYLVKVDLDDLGGARSGMFARAEFVLGYVPALAIPRAAVLTRADIDGVYTIDSDGVAHFRMIRTGRRWGDQIEVLAGLDPGARIVLSSGQPIHTGDRVVAAEAAPAAEARE